MTLTIVSSGSSGNCACINDEKSYIFVDAGVPVSHIKASLGALPVNADVSLFITHEHRDHIAGLTPFINKLKPNIYASIGTLNALLSKGYRVENAFGLVANNVYDFNGFSVLPFNLSHDAAEPLGYKFSINGRVIAFVTDLGIMSDYVFRSVEDSDTMLLESNYDDIMLKQGDYAPALKKRIAGNFGHLSNKDAFCAVGKLSEHGLKNCFLAHVSENNNDYRIVDMYAQSCHDCYNVKAQVLHQKSSVQLEL